MNQFSLKLPIPPSVNAAYANNAGKGRGRHKTKAYKAWLVEADKWLLMQKRGLVPVSGPAMVAVKLPMTMRGDVSNRIKVCEDFLVSRELTSDDSKHVHVSATRDAAVEKGFCEIVVSAAEGYDAEKDLGASIEFCYAAVRERKAAGGEGWGE